MKYSETIKINPEKAMEERAKLEGEELKKERKRKMQLENDSGKYRSSFRASMSSSYMEEGYDDDYDTTSLAAIKGKKSKQNRFSRGDDVEEDTESRRTKTRRVQLDSEGEEEELDDDENNSEMEDFIVNSGSDADNGSDEYDEEVESSKKKSKRKVICKSAACVKCSLNLG